MMFKDFECDSITVPSCPDHNNSKSGKDHALVTALMIALNQVLKHGFIKTSRTDNVKRAIAKAETNLKQAKNEVSLRPYLANAPKDLNIILPYITGSLDPWMRQLTAALVWSVTGDFDRENKFEDAWIWGRNFTRSSKPLDFERDAPLFQKQERLRAYFESLPWTPGWSAYPRHYPPDIYAFQIHLVLDPENWGGKDIIFRHQFYNNSLTWYVWFTASEKTKIILRDVSKYVSGSQGKA